jgi:Putative Flp pilus-assembly TadE/G-like
LQDLKSPFEGFAMRPHHCHRPTRSKAADLLRAAQSAFAVWMTRLDHGALARLRRDESGSYLVVTGMLMPALVGIVGLGTEGGLWLTKHRSMQSAADSAALSAATAYYAQGNNTGLEVQGQAVAAGYGFVNGTGGVTVTVNQPPTSGTHVATAKSVEVIINQPQSRLFSALWSSGPLVIHARSVAVGKGGKGCVISLDPTVSGATTVQGTANVALTNCSMYDNSSNASALTVGGSGTVSAESVNVVGGISGQSSITTTDGVATGQPAIQDPYAGVQLPSFSGCKENSYSTHTTVTLDPGVYCGGLSLNAGANVTLNPGIYYLDRGSLTVNGGATLTGNGVTLVFTSSNGHNYADATINGGAVVNLTAPTTGPTAGIVIFGDRLMTANTAFKLNGGSSEVFRGAIYVPAGAVTFAGGAAATNGCLQLIANTITFVGNSNFAVNCANSGTKPIGSALAQLVE